MNRQAQIKLQQYEKIELEQAHARGLFLKYGERVLTLEEEYEAVRNSRRERSLGAEEAVRGRWRQL